MYYCENCGSEIVDEVQGTGSDATAYCWKCKDYVPCYKGE